MFTSPITFLSRFFRRHALPLALGAALLAGGSALAAPAALPPRPVRPTPPPRATVTPVSDPLPALSACASDTFGLNLSYSKSGGANAQIMRTLNIPTQSQGTITAAISANATALYGVTTNSGAEVLVYGSGSATGTNAAVTVSSASLCYLQFTSTQAAPTSADAALALLKTTFPGVPQKSPYLTVQSGRGGYAFYIITKHPVKGSTQTSAEAILLTATPAGQGKLLLSATVGTGVYAASVPQK